LSDSYLSGEPEQALQDEFYNYSLAEASRRDQLRDQERVRRYLLAYSNILTPSRSQGVFTGAQSQPSPAHAATLERILDRIKEYGGSFSEGAQGIVQALQGHTDGDCKDLAARLNFTRHYSPSKDRELQQKS
jgi:gamma-tubulin complex component 3